MNEKTFDPAELAERLDRSFGSEPPHASVATDLAHGRRRLRRHRALTSLGGLAVAAVVAGTAVAVPRVLPNDRAVLPIAPAGSAGPSDAEILATCLHKESVKAYFGHRVGSAEPVMGEGRLLTAAATEDGAVVATVLAQDGEHWADCHISPGAGPRSYENVYPTTVAFPSATVDGVRAYEPHNEADPRLEGTATSPNPGFGVTCAGTEPEETQARYDEDAGCPTFVMTWNDRRPAEVAAIRVVTPDGASSWADVRRGYVSFAHVGRMTPEMAEQVARGDTPQATRVVFYDADGRVLVDDRDPGHLPQDGGLSTENFPSLAWWLQD